MAQTDATKGAGSLRKALSLLDISKNKPEGVQLADLVRASGLTRPTVYRMVAALTEEGFLRQDDLSRRITLGPKLLELAQGVWRETDLRESARAELDRLAGETGATALLMVRSDYMATCIELSEGNANRTGWRIGETLPVIECAGGMAMLAYGNWGQLDLELERLNVSDAKEIKSRLGVSRSRFYAIDHSPTALGQAGVAAPIFDFSGAPVAAVCLYGDSGSSLHELGAAVVRAARTISRRRGGYPFGIDVPVSVPSHVNPNTVCLAETQCLIGDNPIQEDDRILLIDILAPAILSLDETTSTIKRTPVGEVVGALIPLGEKKYLTAQQTRLSVVDPDGKELWTRSAPGLPAGFRYNDGAIDAEGRIWLGAMDMATSRGTGLLHRYDTLEAEPSTLPGFSLPNGIVFSERGDRMYVVDSMEKTLAEFDYDLSSGSAHLIQRIELLVGETGRPSGLCRGPDNTFFTCHWDGAEIVQIDTLGRKIASHSVPVPRPSGVAYDATRQQLIVASARVRLSDADVDSYPLSGALFAVRLAPGPQSNENDGTSNDV